MKEIWCLFSIDNNYDQPENNLVCFWHEKPSIETLCKTLGLNMTNDEEIVQAVGIFTGKNIFIRRVEYRLQSVKPGIML